MGEKGINAGLLLRVQNVQIGLAILEPHVVIGAHRDSCKWGAGSGEGYTHREVVAQIDKGDQSQQNQTDAAQQFHGKQYNPE